MEEGCWIEIDYYVFIIDFRLPEDKDDQQLKEAQHAEFDASLESTLSGPGTQRKPSPFE